MLLNATTAVSTSSVLLVPYSRKHVLKYHEWMKDEAIQEATASEPLTLEEEYAMQQSWRQDADKLTFIVCRPILSVASSSTRGNETCLSDGDDASEQMIGDTNLFLRFDDDDDVCTDEKEEKSIIAEIELMIAEKQNQGHGYGRAALLSFLWYIVRHEREILSEFLQSNASETADAKLAKEAAILKCLSVKIGKNNTRSLALFESLHFEKISAEPNYFEEFELRRYGLDVDAVENYAKKYGVKDYRAIRYNDQ